MVSTTNEAWYQAACCVRAGLTSYGSQFCMTNALRYARAAPALAMSYISVVLTIIYGYYIFDEVTPSLFSWNMRHMWSEGPASFLLVR